MRVRKKSNSYGRHRQIFVHLVFVHLYLHHQIFTSFDKNFDSMHFKSPNIDKIDVFFIFIGKIIFFYHFYFSLKIFCLI